MEVSLVFPHQLFEHNPALQRGKPVYLIEDELFFSQYRFHRHKIVLHRASMKRYEAWLRQHGYTVFYVETSGCSSLKQFFLDVLPPVVSEVHVVEPSDYLLRRRLVRQCGQHNMMLRWHPSPGFLTDDATFMAAVHERKYLMASFYIQQRRRLRILVDDTGQPTGGKWSFDADNRKKIPNNILLPGNCAFEPGAVTHEAVAYTKQFFPHAPGNADLFNYPTTHEEANKALHHFLSTRLARFGDYEDAILTRESTLFHAVLTPALNIGLLTPQQVVEATLSYHQQHPVALNNLEGFIRQVIGWREFMHGVYRHEGVFQRTRNHFGFSRKLPASFWNATTGIAPVDAVINKVLTTGYCHHIERLMVLGNFMLLCEIDPDDVYRWFMEMFIDSYDWVMVPNVYGMSQYADGGLITTKPYVSGSNYLLKMSDYQKGDWCVIWDALYWRFIDRYQDQFLANPRMAMMVNLLKKMDAEKRKQHFMIADKYLQSLA